MACIAASNSSAIIKDAQIGPGQALVGVTSTLIDMASGTDLTQLVQRFSVAVECQARAIESGDHEEGNRQAKRYIDAFTAIAARGGDGRDALAVLLNSVCPEVRGMAAAFLLGYRSAEATRVLQEVSKGKGFAALGAQESLKRWQEGTWALDPEYPKKVIR